MTLLMLLALMGLADIAAVKSEPDLERRSEMALANADKAIDAAKQAYQGGDDKTEQAALVEVQESVDISYDALEHTNKQPRKSKHYKNAELKLQALLRRLNGFRDQVGFESRGAVDNVIKKVSDVHDALLAAIMSKKK